MLDAQEKARLSWHCRRGMLELDLILQRFLECGLDKLTVEEVKSFDLFLECTDPELFAWLMGHEKPHDEELNKIVTLIRNHT
ncbi:succinate dehydrogenase assembly factor 2 [uncultured Legionella sp.]|uniref:FAD assembly factor SdhE n=1 Tax=uncultured Legionella sp. TaxID=210934 RepID=UPI0026385CCD|nr:succinate dehydrogenase assembly factor 2 [uncultured Legionella sp.]